MGAIKLLRASGPFSLFSLCLALLASPPLAEAAYFDSYELAPNPRRVDLGVQPMAYPLAFISSVMVRDRMLRQGLKEKGLELATHPFRKGNDMVALFGEGRLEGALLGDMPTVSVAVRAPAAIVGLGKRNFSSVVSRNYVRIEELKARRVGYSAGSSSHLVLLRGLDAAKMTEQDVRLVSMEPALMPEALEKGDIDAFSAWEPTPSISLARNPKNRAIYRGMSTDWFVLSREFSERNPEAADLLVAAFARSINWMRASGANVERAAKWVLDDGKAFTGHAPELSIRQAIDIVRKDLLEVAGAPSVPKTVDGALPLSREFVFLKQQKKIPEDVGEDRVRDALSFSGLRKVQADPTRYRLFEYDYGP